jgi:hypothetical protein
MQIQTPEDYRIALERLKRLGADNPERHTIEAAVAAYTQLHENSTSRRGRPPAHEDPASAKFPGDEPA